MIPLTVEELVRFVDAREGTEIDGHARLTVRAVMTDSRKPSVDPAVFFALRTDHADGHDHVAAAASAGAIAAVVERPVPGAGIAQLLVDDAWTALGRLARSVVERSSCRVVAITGSYGKTTVKDLTAAALSPGRRVAASHASFNNELGVPLTMLSVDEGTDVLVAEAGARNAGDIETLARLLLPDVAVVTAVGPVHLETFGDEEGVAREKSRLVTALRSGGVAVLNADDPRVAAMSSLAPASLTISATGATADVRAVEVTTDKDGRVRASVGSPWGDVDLALPMPGIHHLTNALLALSVAGFHGVPLEAAAEAMSTATTSPSRSALHRVGGVTVLDDAYNASPPTMIGALRTLAGLPCEGRRWAVLGVMAELGATSDAQHAAVGRACVGIVDELVVVGSGAVGIAEGAAEASGRTRIQHVDDHAAAADLLVRSVAPGDAVLLKASRVATLDRAAAALIARLREDDAA